MEIKNFAMIILSAVLLHGCSHGSMRGSVAMKTSPTEAHVCLGNKEAKVGDRVTAFNNFCTGKGSSRLDGGGESACEKRKLGEGTVTTLINEHYSVVKFDDGVKFDEGTFVEKL